jgi:ABC-type branched-subunit amino acid transport system ATPase component
MILQASGLSAGYGGAAVVRSVELELAPGRVVALLGPNGAGKTTTMLTLAGYLRPVAGEVRFCGDPKAGPLHRRARKGLSFVTEERSVFMGLTVAQNLGVGRCRPERAYAMFPELQALRSRRAGLLSGGEQQMLTLARALARPRTQILLADELSLGLAPKLVGRLLRAVRAAADGGVAVLLVEQHVHRVLEIADHVHVLAAGRVAYSGAAREARDQIDAIQAHYLGHDASEPPRTAGRVTASLHTKEGT